MDRKTLFDNLIHDIALANTSFERVPEPRGVTDEHESVVGYDQVMNTNMTVNYAAGLDFIHRIRGGFDDASKRKALDLCTGPGHFSICLTKFLDYASVTGIDFSMPMVEVANANARKQGAPVQFLAGDVTKVGSRGLAEASYDLVTFTNAAHHLDSLADVQAVLQSADQLCRPDGTIVLTDMCRLPTADLCRRFVSLTGLDYTNQGLHAMYDDFLASMYAAWSPGELATAVPRATERVWYQIVAAHLPFYQVVVGLPVGRHDLFLRDSLDWKKSGLFRSENAKLDWETTQPIFYSGLIRRLDTAPRVSRQAA